MDIKTRQALPEDAEEFLELLKQIGQFKGFFKIDGEYVDFTLMNLYL